MPESIPTWPHQPVTSFLPPSEREQVKLDSQNQTAEAVETVTLFQAIGVIVGEVKSIADGKMTVVIEHYEYPLLYTSRKQRAFEALKKEIESTGNPKQRLVVYPKVIHFPKREQPHVISFQVVGFDRGREENTVSDELQDLTFKVSGLWQFIPVCAIPCISIFRNFAPERLEYIKQAGSAQKVKFLKASHLPLLWKDAPVRPFRFNPKADFDQGHPVFVSLKVKFLPHRNMFGFVEQLAPPQEDAPKFLKASKKDKALVQQAAKQNKTTSQPPQTLTKSSDATGNTAPVNEKLADLPATPEIRKEKPKLKKIGN